MDYNPFTLSFTGKERPLEERFFQSYFQRSLKVTRITVLLAAFFYAVFGILDDVMFPNAKSMAWVIRYTIVCPIILFTFIFSYSKKYMRYWQASLIIIIAFAGTGIVAMIAVAPSPANILYYAGLILVIMYGYTVLRIRFIWATLSCWGIIILYEMVAIFIIKVPMPLFISNNFFFITANLVGMIASYSMEYYARTSFYYEHHLGEEKAKVSEVNEELRQKVEELSQAVAEINTLSGLLPICAKCKKIRDDKGYWKQIEDYISTHSDAQFSHSICPECAEKLYGTLFAQKA